MCLTSLDCLENLYILEANRFRSHVPPALSVSTSLSGHSTGLSAPISQFTSSPHVAQCLSSHLSSYLAGIFETLSSHRQSFFPAPDSSDPQYAIFPCPKHHYPPPLQHSTTKSSASSYPSAEPSHPSTAKMASVTQSGPQHLALHVSFPIPPALPMTHCWLLADCMWPAMHHFLSLPLWHTLSPVPPPSTSTTPTAAETALRRPSYTRRQYQWCYQRCRNRQLLLSQRRPFSAPSSVSCSGKSAPSRHCSICNLARNPSFYPAPQRALLTVKDEDADSTARSGNETEEAYKEEVKRKLQVNICIMWSIGTRGTLVLRSGIY